MKKFIYTLGIIITSFVMISGVKAETLFKCKYTINFNNKIPNATDKNINFEAWVTDQDKASLSSFDNVNLGGNYFNWASGMEKDFNNAAKTNNTCPSIQFIYYVNTNQVTGSLAGRDTDGYESDTVDGTIYESNIQTSTRKELCTRTSTLRNQNYSISISFSKVGTSNEWKISGSGNDSGWVSANQGLTDKTGNSYILSSDAINKFFISQDSCKETTLYLKVKGEVGTGIYAMDVQTTKPDDTENGAFSVNIAGGDNGQHDISIDVTPPDRDYVTGCDMLGGEGSATIKIIKKLYGYFTWIIPILVVVLSILDFVKVVGAGDDKDFKKAQNNLAKRIIIGIVFFLVPLIVSLFINISGITDNFTNGDSIIETITCVLK